MKELTLRNRLAYLLIIAKFVLIVWLLFLWLTGGYKTEQMTTALTIIVPMFSVHVSLIVKYFLEQRRYREVSKGKQLNGVTIFITFAFPSLYVLYLFAVLTAKIHYNNMDAIKALLALGETFFGVYLGQIIATYYKKPETN